MGSVIVCGFYTDDYRPLGSPSGGKPAPAQTAP
jgi:hypothetical protein